MPKGMDPKAYAARVTKAKKVIAAMDPAMKTKIKDMYPKITKEDITKQMLSPKTTLSDMEKRMRAKPTATPKATAGSLARRTPSMAKPTANTPAKKTSISKTTKPGGRSTKEQIKKIQPKGPAKPKTLTGPAAVRELQRQVSPAGVKKAEMDAKKAIAKKYPGLTKKSK